MRSLVKLSLKPAIFSTPMVLKNAARPVPNPIRSAKVHLRQTYCTISAFALDLQSCLNISFSKILHTHTHECYVKYITKIENE